MMACFYLENLNQRNQWQLQRLRCQTFKNIVGLQIITSMLVISMIHFYSDKEYTLPEVFQCGCLLLEALHPGIRPLPL